MQQYSVMLINEVADCYIFNFKEFLILVLGHTTKQTLQACS